MRSIAAFVVLMSIASPALAQGHRWGFQEDCDVRGEPRIGMNWQDLYETCWGRPSKVNTTQTGRGTHDQLVYPKGNYIYLENGYLTSIQTSR